MQLTQIVHILTLQITQQLVFPSIFIGNFAKPVECAGVVRNHLMIFTRLIKQRENRFVPMLRCPLLIWTHIVYPAPQILLYRYLPPLILFSRLLLIWLCQISCRQPPPSPLLLLLLYGILFHSLLIHIHLLTHHFTTTLPIFIHHL